MNQTVDLERAHLRTWELLPWIVNGSATDAERVEVDRHVMACERCRAELVLQTQLYGAMNANTVPGPDVETGLARLWQQIDAADRQPDEDTPVGAPAARGASGRWWAAVACALGAVVLVQTGGLAVLTAQSTHDSPARYRTLSAQPSDASARATIRLVVDRSMSVGELQGLLASLHLQIVAGPGDSGVYSLSPTSAQASGNVADQVDALRTASGVRFAEPVEHGGAS
ncbi:zf-HC2 domain-containing protein [Paraburkholderia phosphatilytica]|uniref:zf-HC2 domain-containing protein n=1 Tax=Paraburkholderia phosphatilytica TaxID=2282883 RepID=UPI000E507AC1|nr:zf-HC2 domain-containing protein [Paraburkholderia phosphatilytica]